MGIDWNSIERVKFAGGVVGKLTLIAVVAVLVVGVISYRGIAPNLGTGQLILAAGGLVTVLAIIILAYFAIIRTTDKHPDLAAIEGMDLVTLRLALGTKDKEEAPNQKGGPRPIIDVDIAQSIEGAPE